MLIMIQTDPNVHVKNKLNTSRLERLQHVSDWRVEFLGLVYVVFIPSHSPDTLVTLTLH